MKIYVRYLTRVTTEEDLREAFSPFGRVESVVIVTSEPGGVPIGLAYVDMPDDDEALSAVLRINDISLGGFPVRLDEPRCGSGRRDGVDRRHGMRPSKEDRRVTGRRSHSRLVA